MRDDFHPRSGLAPEQFLENLGLDEKEMAFFFGPGAQQTGLLQQASRFSEKIPLAQRIKGDLLIPGLEKQTDLSFLNDEHPRAGFPFTEEKSPGRKNLAEFLEKEILRFHLPSFVSTFSEYTRLASPSIFPRK